MRNTIITCATPRLSCTCGEERDLTSPAGLPPVGWETMCLRPGCGRHWHLCKVDPSGGSWLWADFPAPKEESRPVALATLTLIARHVLGVEAGLAGLGYTPLERGTC